MSLVHYSGIIHLSTLPLVAHKTNTLFINIIHHPPFSRVDTPLVTPWCFFTAGTLSYIYPILFQQPHLYGYFNQSFV